MFSATARHYDAFYDAAGKDYAAESAGLLARIRARMPEARTLLDVACGTGRHVEHLSREVDCTAVDVEPALLQAARLRCPDVRFVEADMTTLDLDETFDVVTCLFSSIGYVRDASGLERAIAAMAGHLRPGGLLVVEPSFSPERFKAGRMDRLDVDADDLVAVRMNTTARDGDVAILDMHYLIGVRGAIEYAHERHELGLFTSEQYAYAFAAANLVLDTEAEGLTGRGLLIGTRGG